MNYEMELSVFVRGGLPEEAFVQAFDAVADALYNCDGVEDADLAGDSKTATLTFTMNVLDVDGPEEALSIALGVVRTALHTSGGSTPGWEDRFEFLKQTISAEGLVSA